MRDQEACASGGGIGDRTKFGGDNIVFSGLDFKDWLAIQREQSEETRLFGDRVFEMPARPTSAISAVCW